MKMPPGTALMKKEVKTKSRRPVDSIRLRFNVLVTSHSPQTRRKHLIKEFSQYVQYDGREF